MVCYGIVWSAHSQQETVAGGSLWDCSIDAHDGMVWYGMVWSAHSQQGTVAGGSLWDWSIDAHDGTRIENNDNELPESWSV